MARQKYNPNQGLLFGEKLEVAPPIEKPPWQEWEENFTQMEARVAQLGFKIEQQTPPHSIYAKTYLVNPLLAPLTIEARPYLISIVERATNGNSLIVLPTGTGKTMIIEVLTIIKLQKNPAKKILILAPTKPICEQHLGVLTRTLPGVRTTLITGKISPKKRRPLWLENQVIVATCETIAEELGKANSPVGQPHELQAIFYDEVHHLEGDHAYGRLADYYKNAGIHTIGLTGSLHYEFRNISRLVKRIGVEEEQILIMDKDSDDIKAFTQYRYLRRIRVPPRSSPAYDYFKKVLLEELRKRVDIFRNDLNTSLSKDFFYYDTNTRLIGVNVKEFKKLLGVIKRQSENKQANFRKILFISWALVMLTNRALWDLDQGWTEFGAFLTKQFYRWKREKRVASGRFVNNPRVRELAELLYHHGAWAEVPIYFESRTDANLDLNKLCPEDFLDDQAKLTAIRKLISWQFRREPASQVIVFVSDRSTARRVTDSLKRIFPNYTSEIFVGTKNQPYGRGMSQKKQQEILKRFWFKEIKTLVSTSIGEEGIDFPSVRMVIQYSLPMTSQQMDQRAGRTARHGVGWFITLVTRDSYEERIIAKVLTQQKQSRKIGLYLREHQYKDPCQDGVGF